MPPKKRAPKPMEARAFNDSESGSDTGDRSRSRSPRITKADYERVVQEKDALEKKVEAFNAKVAHLTEQLREQEEAAQRRHQELLETLSANNKTSTEAEAPMEVTPARVPEQAVAVPRKRGKRKKALLSPSISEDAPRTSPRKCPGPTQPRSPLQPRRTTTPLPQSRKPGSFL